MRKVILHYHLFKNAGTSLDAAFKENFSEEKGEWVTKEFPNQPAANREQVRQWILDNPQAKCFSSHTALLPLPKFEDIEVFPVIFVRHPIDRIASAYSFEKKQGADTFGSVLARNTSLKGYIETRLSLKNDKQCRNFHAQHFRIEQPANSKQSVSDILGELPFIGLVEQYGDSLEVLNRLLKEFGFKNLTLNAFNQNVSRENSMLKDKMEMIKSTVSEDFYDKLKAINELDFVIYQLIAERYSSQFGE